MPRGRGPQKRSPLRHGALVSTTNKPKRGRPSQGLEEMVRVPATPELKALVERAAERLGITAAEAWRRAAHQWLGSGPPSDP